MLFSDIKEVDLFEYINYNEFRTIMPQHINIPKGAKDIKVQIDMVEKSRLKQSAKFPERYKGTLSIFGYVKINENIEKNITEKSRMKETVLILSEFDKERFLLTFRQADGTEKSMYFVKLEKMEELLEKCLHPNI